MPLRPRHRRSSWRYRSLIERESRDGALDRGSHPSHDVACDFEPSGGITPATDESQNPVLAERKRRYLELSRGGEPGALTPGLRDGA